MATVLKFGLVIQLENRQYVYLHSIVGIVYLSLILDREMTTTLITRHLKIAHSTKKVGNPVYKVVKLTTEQFEGMGAHCHKTGHNPDVLEVDIAVIRELNKDDKKAIHEELLAQDGFVDESLQEYVRGLNFW